MVTTVLLDDSALCLRSCCCCCCWLGRKDERGVFAPIMITTKEIAGSMEKVKVGTGEKDGSKKKEGQMKG